MCLRKHSSCRLNLEKEGGGGGGGDGGKGSVGHTPCQGVQSLNPPPPPKKKKKKMFSPSPNLVAVAQLKLLELRWFSETGSSSLLTL